VDVVVNEHLYSPLEVVVAVEKNHLSLLQDVIAVQQIVVMNNPVTVNKLLNHLVTVAQFHPLHVPTRTVHVMHVIVIHVYVVHVDLNVHVILVFVVQNCVNNNYNYFGFKNDNQSTTYVLCL
jgi:hypothetical protein